MRKSNFTESQIVRVLKEVEGGRSVGEVCREYGISDATYYNWKSKYGGMEMSDIKHGLPPRTIETFKVTIEFSGGVYG